MRNLLAMQVGGHSNDNTENSNNDNGNSNNTRNGVLRV